jgi:hypothetical protein
MRKISIILLLLFLQLILSVSCCGDGDTGVIHLPNCDLHPIYSNDMIYWLDLSPDGNTIVFSDWANKDLWTITSTGENLTQITDLAGDEYYPSWQPGPNADKLVFGLRKPPSTSIYTLKLGDQNPVEIIKFERAVWSTSWSHDGQKIVYLQQLYLGTEDTGIFTVPAEGGESELISNSEGWGKIWRAQASPARDVAVFVENKDNIFQLRSIDLDGGDPITIYTFPEGAGNLFGGLDESYDGSTIACIGPYPNPNARNLFLVPSSGGEPIVITDFNAESFDHHPSWHPDGGKLIIALQNPPGKRQPGIYLVELKL